MIEYEQQLPRAYAIYAFAFGLLKPHELTRP